MAHDLGVLLGAALRDIRVRSGRTQEDWEEVAGMSQSYTSAVERGKSGWDAIRSIADAVERAGADPLDLLRLAVARVDAPTDLRELLALWPVVPEDARQAILTLLRTQLPPS